MMKGTISPTPADAVALSALTTLRWCGQPAIRSGVLSEDVQTCMFLEVCGNRPPYWFATILSRGTGLERLHIRQENPALRVPQVTEDHAIKTSVTPDQNPEEMQVSEAKKESKRKYDYK